jgi:hypothetical protein
VTFTPDVGVNTNCCVPDNVAPATGVLSTPGTRRSTSTGFDVVPVKPVPSVASTVTVYEPSTTD